uniref:Uncharacterized protein n=1 Tax=Megaselia scalaris TaxID=36166 RepID=T1GY41_MEGSC
MENAACYVRVEDGLTIRGCVENTEQELSKIGCSLDNANKETCEVCDYNFDGCNVKLFPEHRAECLQCDGDFESDCFTNADQKGLPCLLYVPGDRCYIWKTDFDKR